MSALAGKSILITGGTGSFGNAFCKEVLKSHDPRRVVVFSRDELKQYHMKENFKDDRLRWFIGDVRDSDRLEMALSNIDFVVHAAALKQVDTAEYNPFECIATNVLGAENLIRASIQCGVSRVVALSTDKASSPVNLYGASKLCADKLFVAGNSYATHGKTRFSVVRYGNVAGSRGSVVPHFQSLAATGELPITDPQMTRFWITLSQAVQFVVSSFEIMSGGEIFVPKIPSVRVVDIATAVNPKANHLIVGIRPGEKIHEEMISENEAYRTYDLGDRYVISPVQFPATHERLRKAGVAVGANFRYQSHENEHFLSVEAISDSLLSLHD